MEQSLLALFSTSFLVFALVVAIVTSILRNVTEAIFKKLTIKLSDKWKELFVDFWKEWVLPILPLVVGGLSAYLFQTIKQKIPFGKKQGILDEEEEITTSDEKATCG